MSASSRHALATQGSGESQDAAAKVNGAATEAAAAIAIRMDQQRKLIFVP